MNLLFWIWLDLPSSNNKFRTKSVLLFIIIVTGCTLHLCFAENVNNVAHMFVVVVVLA